MKYNPHALIVLLIVLSCLPLAAISNQEFSYLDEKCNPIKDCKPTRNCTYQIKRDTRECNQCFLKDPFSKRCLARGNGPSCEAAKAAQNSIYKADFAAKKFDCERIKEVERLTCEAGISEQRSLCISKREKTYPNELVEYLAKAQVSYYQEMPQTLLNKLAKLYPKQTLESIKIYSIIDEGSVPVIFENEEYGFTIGTSVFIKNELDTIPIIFWVSQIELSRLYESYGINDMYVAISQAPKIISGIVNERVERICEKVLCK